MDRIDTLVAAMTLAEKIGQLTMRRRLAVTGPVLPGDFDRAPRRPGRQPPQPLGPGRARDPAPRGRGVAARHSALLRLRRHPRPSHDLPGAARRGGAFDPELWEPRPARRRGRPPPTASTDLRADARRGARPALGPHREGPGEDPWLAAASPRPRCAASRAPISRRPTRRGRRQAFLRLRRRGPGANTPPSTFRSAASHEVYLPPFEAAVAAGVAAIMPAFTDLAGIPMTADRRCCAAGCAASSASRASMISDYNAIARAHQARRRRRSRRGRRAGAERRRRHRHDGRRLSPTACPRALRARPGDDGTRSTPRCAGCCG